VPGHKLSNFRYTVALCYELLQRGAHNGRRCIVVTVEESRRAELDRLAAAFESKGLHVQQKLPRFRTIVGTGDSSLLEELKSMDGVEAVRPEGKFQLPPMDEKIPQ
jgi:hypothetical protein